MSTTWPVSSTTSCREKRGVSELAINHYVCPDGYGVTRFLDDVAVMGVGAVGLTRAALGEMPVPDLRRDLQARGMSVTTLNSAGFFTFCDTADRQRQADENKRLLETAAEIDAQMLTVITGGMNQSASVTHAREEVRDGLAALDEQAAAMGVQLGLEPIHPVGIRDKGCVNSIAQACALTAPLTNTGLILDFYHSWWDVDLSDCIRECPERVHVIQICNVSFNTNGYPSRTTDLEQGVLSVGELVRNARDAGYVGPFEFEIFATDHDGMDTSGIIARAVTYFDSFDVWS